MDFESILVEILLGTYIHTYIEDKETLNLSRNRKKRYRRLFLNGRDCLIVGATAESLNECYFLHTI